MLCLATSASSAAQAVRTGYASVNGLELYYEIHGTGEPLILLHGGLGSSEMFGPNLPALARIRQVVAVDLQAHGRTADIDRPIRIQSMADDIAALLKHLGMSSADIMGYSMGGAVALQVAIRHPQAVRRLVVASTPIKRSAYYPEILAAQKQVGPAIAEQMKQLPLYESYSRLAPNKENWPVLLGKMGDLMAQDYDWSKEVAALKAPTLIIAADADLFRTAHAVEIFELLGGGQKDPGWDGTGRPNAQLAVLPGLTHYNTFMSPALVAAAIPFLNAPSKK